MDELPIHKFLSKELFGSAKVREEMENAKCKMQKRVNM